MAVSIDALQDSLHLVLGLITPQNVVRQVLLVDIALVSDKIVIYVHIDRNIHLLGRHLIKLLQINELWLLIVKHEWLDIARGDTPGRRLTVLSGAKIRLLRIVYRIWIILLCRDGAARNIGVLGHEVILVVPRVRRHLLEVLRLRRSQIVPLTF